MRDCVCFVYCWPLFSIFFFKKFVGLKNDVEGGRKSLDWTSLLILMWDSDVISYEVLIRFHFIVFNAWFPSIVISDSLSEIFLGFLLFFYAAILDCFAMEENRS